MDSGKLWTLWTIRLSMGLYVAALALRGLSRGRRGWLIWSRAGWTIACLAYLLHVACAFEYYHHWSHQEAFESTARQTAETTGFDSSFGLYANYAFTLVWIADACWWWSSLERYEQRPRVIECGVQGFLGFMAFNATVIFASGLSRALGIGGCVLLAFVWAARMNSTEKIHRSNVE